MRNTNTTIVDFYQGAYGPTIRIDIQDPNWFRFFKDSISLLERKIINDLDLLKLEGVEQDEISGLKLEWGSKSSLSMIAPVQSGDYPSFLWIVNADDLKNIVNAIDRFMRSDKPGHYYLYDDDFLIELAYKE